MAHLTAKEGWHILDHNGTWSKRSNDLYYWHYEKVSLIARSGIRVVIKPALPSSATHALTWGTGAQKRGPVLVVSPSIFLHDVNPSLANIANDIGCVWMIPSRNSESPWIKLSHHVKLKPRFGVSEVAGTAIREEANRFHMAIRKKRSREPN